MEPAAPIAAAGGAQRHLSRNVVTLGLVSLLMGASSGMILGLVPVVLVKILGASALLLGTIEGIAEGTTSFAKIVSGPVSDWIKRRKPLVVLGYGLSAITKLLFPLATTAADVLVARFLDRVGKGLRDAPRDALLADITPSEIRGSGFGLRGALYTVGAVIGPLLAIGLMALSGDDFRLVFWLALIPGFASVAVLAIGVREPAERLRDGEPAVDIERGALRRLPVRFWWAVSIAAILSLARFSQAFLLLKAHAIGIDAALVPVMLICMNLVYGLTSYPFGVLADQVDPRRQLGIGIAVLLGADLTLAAADTIWTLIAGAALWGLQMGVIQGLLSATVANAAPHDLRGTAFGIYDLVVGIATFLASTGAGALWLVGGAPATFAVGASLAALAAVMLVAGPPLKAVPGGRPRY